MSIDVPYLTLLINRARRTHQKARPPQKTYDHGRHGIASRFTVRVQGHRPEDITPPACLSESEYHSVFRPFAQYLSPCCRFLVPVRPIESSSEISGCMGDKHRGSMLADRSRLLNSYPKLAILYGAWLVGPRLVLRAFNDSPAEGVSVDIGCCWVER
jgi:hypothetical protein